MGAEQSTARRRHVHVFHLPSNHPPGSTASRRTSRDVLDQNNDPTDLVSNTAAATLDVGQQSVTFISQPSLKAAVGGTESGLLTVGSCPVNRSLPRSPRAAPRWRPIASVSSFGGGYDGATLNLHRVGNCVVNAG